MPVTGGLLPQAGPQFSELAAITRRAFIPQLIIQIYNASPLMASFLANAQSAGGGVSSVTVPVQGSPMVVASAADYSGSFAQPPILTAVQDSVLWHGRTGADRSRDHPAHSGAHE
jgi:hypothetical protein